jgi:hypothetical protein
MPEELGTKNPMKNPVTLPIEGRKSTSEAAKKTEQNVTPFFNLSPAGLVFKRYIIIGSKNRAGYNFEATAKLRETEESTIFFFKRRKKQAKENNTGNVSHIPQPLDIQIKKGLRNQRNAAFSASTLLSVISPTILWRSSMTKTSETKNGNFTTELKSTPGTYFTL